jgi:Ca-activated chloride channel family protein
LSLDIKDNNTTFEKSSENHRFASAVASYGLLLRDSEYKGETSFDNIKSWAQDSRSYDLYGYKREFIELIDLAKDIY